MSDPIDPNKLVDDAMEALHAAVNSDEGSHRDWCRRVAEAHDTVAAAYAQARRVLDPPTSSAVWWALLDAETDHRAQAVHFKDKATR